MNFRIEIKGKSFPLHNYKYNSFDLDREKGTGRNQLGTTFRDRVATKVQINCTFVGYHKKETEELLSLIRDDFIDVNYFDVKLGKRKTMRCKVGDINIPIWYADENDYITDKFELVFTEK